MNMDMNHMQTLGILAQVTHLSSCHAKQMFGKYDLKPGQAGILFVLNKEGELSQRELSRKMNPLPSPPLSRRWSSSGISGVNRTKRISGFCGLALQIRGRRVLTTSAGLDRRWKSWCSGG